MSLPPDDSYKLMQYTSAPNSQQPSNAGKQSRGNTVNWLADAGLLLATISYLALAYYTFAVVGERKTEAPTANANSRPSFNQLVLESAPLSIPEDLHAQRPAATAR